MRRAFGCHGRMSANKQQWPNARAKKIWQTVNGAQKAALASLVQANSSQIVYAADVDKAARDVISAEGWGAFFTHRVGHGMFLFFSLELFLGVIWLTLLSFVSFEGIGLQVHGIHFLSSFTYPGSP